MEGHRGVAKLYILSVGKFQSLDLNKISWFQGFIIAVTEARSQASKSLGHLWWLSKNQLQEATQFSSSHRRAHYLLVVVDI